MRNFWRRLVERFFGRRAAEARRAVDDEIAMHLEMKTAALIAAGKAPEEAGAEAERQFGDLAETKDALLSGTEARHRKRGRRDWIGGWWQDVRYALRSLARTPGVTAAVIVMLALGIGANAAMFGILDRLFLKPPAHIRDPASVVWLYRQLPGPGGQQFTSLAFDFRLYTRLSSDVRSLTGMSGYWPMSYSVGRGQSGVPVSAGIVTGGFFDLLGVAAVLGRTLGSGDDAPGAVPAAVVSHEFWLRYFNRRADVLGDTIRLGSVIYTVVGVLPEGFGGPEVSARDLWIPAQIAGPAQVPGGRDRWQVQYEGGLAFMLLARLGSGVDADAVAHEASAVLQASSRWYVRLPETADIGGGRNPHGSVLVGPLLQARGPALGVKGRADPPLPLIVGGVAGIVLLIACSNVANLLSLRTAARRREIAVRHALGSGRWRIARLLLIESVIIALGAGAAALAVAAVTAPVLRTTLLPGQKWLSPPVDPRVLGAAALIALAIGLVTGMAPAAHAARSAGLDDLRVGQRSARRARTPGRFAILVVQSALTVVLLVGTALFLRSFSSARAQELGVDVDRLLVANVSTAPGQSPTTRDALVTAAVDRTLRVPDVTAVAVTTSQPLRNWTVGRLWVPGFDPVRGQISPLDDMYVAGVTPNYFDVMGGHVASGRGFSDRDDANGERVALVNQEMARRLWPGESALGKCLHVGGREAPCRTVVGVVSDVRDRGARKVASGWYYLPLSQYVGTTRTLVVRANGSPGELIPPMLRLMSELYPDLPGSRVYTLSSIIDSQTRRWQIGMALFATAAGLALLLAAVGLYAVIAFGVRQRAHEFGIRRALGAQAADLVAAVMRQGFAVALIGVAFGLALAWYGSRFVAPLLFPDMSAKDPLAMGGAAVILTIVALAACLIPASMATRADPRQALQAE